MSLGRFVLLALVSTGGCDSSPGSGSHHDLSANQEQDLAVGDGASKDGSFTDGPVVTVDSGVSGINSYTALSLPGAEIFTLKLDHTLGQVTVTDLTTPFTLSGTFETLASGFLRFFLYDVCTGAGCTPQAAGSFTFPGDKTATALPLVAHSLEAPGAFILFIPSDSGGAIVGGQSSACVAGMDTTYNAVPLGADSATVVVLSLSGVSTVDPTLTLYPLDSDAGAPQSPAPSPGPCSNSVTAIGRDGGASEDGGASLLSSGGTGVVALAISDQGAALGLKQTAITLSELTNNRTFRGLLIGNDTNPVSLAFGAFTAGQPASGVITPILDVDANTLDTSNQAIVHITSIQNGLVTGDIASTPNAVHFQGGGLQVGSSNLMFLTGSDGTGGSQELILISNP